MRHIICTLGGVVGGIFATLFGGWTEGLLVLVILMAIDYISGLVVAGVFHASPKSPNGGLESKAGLKGLVRKLFVLALVAVAHLIDRLIGTSYVRDAATIAFCLNEVISILENAGLMGIPIPKVLRKAIDVLRDKAGESEKPPDGGTGETDCHTSAAALVRNDRTGEGLGTDSSTPLRFAQNDKEGMTDSSTPLRSAQNDREGE